MKHLIPKLTLSLLIGAAAPAAMAAPGGGMGHAPMAPSATMQKPIAPTGTAAPTAATTGFSGKPKALGQPNQSCGSATAPNTPGNAASAPGSAFNPNGTAGTKYAGEQPQNSVNPAAVSQYDAACAHQR